MSDPLRAALLELGALAREQLAELDREPVGHAALRLAGSVARGEAKDLRDVIRCVHEALEERPGPIGGPGQSEEERVEEEG